VKTKSILMDICVCVVCLWASIYVMKYDLLSNFVPVELITFFVEENNKFLRKEK